MRKLAKDHAPKVEFAVLDFAFEVMHRSWLVAGQRVARADARFPRHVRTNVEMGFVYLLKGPGHCPVNGESEDLWKIGSGENC